MAFQARADKPDWPGIWGIWGGETINNQSRPWYKGVVVTVRWSEIESQQNQFDFSILDSRINQAIDNGLLVVFKVYHGDESPDWLYDNGVPRVKTTGWSRIFPYYLDPNFKVFLKRMINKVAEHVDTYPSGIRQKIIGMQAPAGQSGDPQPYYGTPVNPAYNINSWNGTEWAEYNKEIFLHYYNAYKEKEPRIFIIAKPSQAVHDFLLENAPGMGRKTFQVAQGHQLNNEMNLEWLRSDLVTFHGNWAIRARGEYSNTGNPWFSEAPVWNMHWQCLWMLTYGVDMFNQWRTNLQDYQGYVESFEFFNTHAGYKDPRDSKGVFCALRDGLDYKDTKRFPEAQYGSLGNNKNRQRYLNIANALSAYGAKQGDPDMLGLKNLDFVLHAKALNDVGFNIWPANYRLYLYQHDPNGTSQGYWRVGSKNEPYGRFARGFNHRQGKDAMYFNIDDGFFFDQALNGQYEVKVRVVYFDQGTGSWALKYDAVRDAQKTAFTVTKTNSGQWKERIITISDGYFGNRCPNSTDLMLANTDNEDDVFHMLELTRETGDRKGYWGDGTPPAAIKLRAPFE